ncbi:MAG: DUF5916 domain-containing protein [Bacteroidota bacterium]
MKSPVFLLLIYGCFLNSASAQTELNPDKKEVAASFTKIPPLIDGILDEPAWMTAPSADGFVQNRPNPGEAPSQKSDVRILYDDQGIYLGAMLYDTQADSIQKELSERDGLGNTDWFGIIIDAYRDGINGFGFLVTASNIQFDTKYSTFGEDSGWDAVWESNVTITDDGWVVEMRIPFSALRFPDTEAQVWHLNYVRSIARLGEKSFWSEVDPQVDGFLNQAGYLKGIENIKPPPRLQATPFIAVYGQQHHDVSSDPVNTYGRSISGGMDVKWGLSDAFTLDMTLIPDFGEAQSDNQVLNLSPFEVQFDENRPFFTEGTELFNKGNLFYSRRIGGQPIDYYEVTDNYTEDEIISNPAQSQLYNATKVSGRTTKGLGVGFFNATSGRTYARVKTAEQGEMDVLTDPLTNYNVLVLDQNLANNSYATLINTTVMRESDAYDANVTGTDFLLRNKSNTYSIGGRAALSQKYHTDQTDLGHTVALRLRKTSGNLQAGLNYLEESDTYDPNDLGFLSNNNERSFSGFIEYNQYESFGKFNRGGIGLFSAYNRLYAPSAFTRWNVNVWTWAESKNFWNFNVWGNISPGKRFDYFEPRHDGRVWEKSGGGNLGFWMGTDSRKKLRLTLNSGVWSAFEPAWHELWGRVGARYRFNDRFNMNLNLRKSFDRNDPGYVNDEEVTVTDPESQEEYTQTDILFGKRDRNTIELSYRANYTFDANMTLSFRLRHYWSSVAYNSFHLLSEEGHLLDTDYNESHDGDFDAFNIDLVYRWRFAPGSDIFVVWKNSMYSSSDFVPNNYFNNLDGLFQNPQDNSLSVKLIYFLDYASLVGQR